MSIIACTTNCVYQEDGICRLDRVVSAGESNKESGCMYYVRKAKKNKNNKSDSL